MDNGTLVAANHHIEGCRPGVRRASVVVALAMVVSLFILMQRPADAAPRTGAAGAGVSAQVTTTVSPACAVLFGLQAAFTGNPFFAAALAEVNQELAEFGCIAPVTTTTTTIRPTTTTTTVVVPPALPATTCATLLATRASFVGTEFAIFIPFIDIALAAAGCGTISG